MVTTVVSAFSTSQPSVSYEPSPSNFSNFVLPPLGFSPTGNEGATAIGENLDGVFNSAKNVLDSKLDELPDNIQELLPADTSMEDQQAILDSLQGQDLIGKLPASTPEEHQAGKRKPDDDTEKGDSRYQKLAKTGTTTDTETEEDEDINQPSQESTAGVKTRGATKKGRFKQTARHSASNVAKLPPAKKTQGKQLNKDNKKNLYLSDMQSFVLD